LQDYVNSSSVDVIYEDTLASTFTSTQRIYTYTTEKENAKNALMFDNYCILTIKNIPHKGPYWADTGVLCLLECNFILDKKIL
jgi:hypothetical protein